MFRLIFITCKSTHYTHWNSFNLQIFSISSDLYFYIIYHFLFTFLYLCSTFYLHQITYFLWLTVLHIGFTWQSFYFQMLSPVVIGSTGKVSQMANKFEEGLVLKKRDIVIPARTKPEIPYVSSLVSNKNRDTLMMAFYFSRVRGIGHQFKDTHNTFNWY